MTGGEVFWVWLLSCLELVALWTIALYVRQSLLLHVKLVRGAPLVFRRLPPALLLRHGANEEHATNEV